MNRTEDGYWLLDSGGGARHPGRAGRARWTSTSRTARCSTRCPSAGSACTGSAGEHTLPMVFVTLPELEVQEVAQTYRTVSVLDGDQDHAVIAFPGTTSPPSWWSTPTAW